MFEGSSDNIASVELYTAENTLGANTFGAAVLGTTTNSGASAYIQGSWAVRPVTVVATTATSGTPGVNHPGTNSGSR